ncbi:cation diffusion facilitator family transporter [Paenibacillus sp. FSL W8-0187]|uniref:cation diffusion facilitator family transporter n=1 Tax=Paenibacillus TaxID=44249 RepID=UPI0030D764C9
MSNERLNHTETVLWTGIVTDFALALCKGIVGYLSGSKALIGDALHSAANAVTLLVDRLPSLGIFGNKSSIRDKRKVSDTTEPVISILFAVLLIMGGIQIAVSAIQTMASGDLEPPTKSALLAVFISLAVNEAVFQYQCRQIKRNKDPRYEVLSADHRFALYSSLTVLIGVSLAMGGSYFEWTPLLYMDSVAALIVACLVIRKGYILIVHSVYGTLVEEKRHEHEADFMDTIQRVHGVITIEELKVQEYGQIRHVNIEVKITVNPRTSVLEAQEIAERIRKLLTHRFIQVTDAKVHVVPYEPGYPYKSNYDLMDNDMPTLPQ